MLNGSSWCLPTENPTSTTLPQGSSLVFPREAEPKNQVYSRPHKRVSWVWICRLSGPGLLAWVLMPFCLVRLPLFFVIALVNYAGPRAGPVSDWLLFSASQSCLPWPLRGSYHGKQRGLHRVRGHRDLGWELVLDCL